jgi:aryl-alcohol dehydrogenase-like predicted oxidoreductase
LSNNVIGLGCMRLSTSPDRNPDNGIRVIHAALDAGITLLDTADVYCWDDNDIGHNERLIAQALQSWHGDAATIEVATKGGLRRPDGAWVPDGRAVHLKAACAASRRALGVDVIDLYQLHVVDPKVPFATSVRALAALQREGSIRRIGLSNVTVTQIEQARALAEIDSVQVALSVLEDENLRNGVAEYCAEHGIRLLAYRPLGGARGAKQLARNQTLQRVGTEHAATAQEIALAWLCDLSEHIVPIPGPTRVEHAAALARVSHIELTLDNRQSLDAQFNGRLLRVPRAQRRAPAAAAGDVVLIMGMPGAGKSTLAAEMEAGGYARLNRDEQGGRLADLIRELDRGLASGQREWVLDNTYASRADRNDVIECAWRHGVPVRLLWLDTDIADAQINAITRLIEAHGSLPMPQDLRAHGKTDHRYFGPDAQFRYQRDMEPPSEEEGFKSIERRAFERRANGEDGGKAVFFDPTEVTAAAVDALRAFQQDGFLLFGLAWHPPGTNKPRLSGIDYEYQECVHPAGPPICWCRKPLPGLVLECALLHRLDLRQCILVGKSVADQTMATRLGMRQVPLDTLVL